MSFQKMELKESISMLEKHERPRERLLAKGAEFLSDVELLTVLIGSGIKGRGVHQLASDVLDALERRKDSSILEVLRVIRGIGGAKTAQIAAALEFARRRYCMGLRKISFPSDVIPLVTTYADRRQEHFLSLSLNGANEVIEVRVVSVGLVNRTIVHPREVFADILIDRASGVIVCHNHPSGHVQPSTEDREITRRLKEAGELLGIQLLDHIIFSRETYYSFLEEGEL